MTRGHSRDSHRGHSRRQSSRSFKKIVISTTRNTQQPLHTTLLQSSSNSNIPSLQSRTSKPRPTRTFQAYKLELPSRTSKPPTRTLLPSRKLDNEDEDEDDDMQLDEEEVIQLDDEEDDMLEPNKFSKASKCLDKTPRNLQHHQHLHAQQPSTMFQLRLFIAFVLLVALSSVNGRVLTVSNRLRILGRKCVEKFSFLDRGS